MPYHLGYWPMFGFPLWNGLGPPTNSHARTVALSPGYTPPQRFTALSAAALAGMSHTPLVTKRIGFALAASRFQRHTPAAISQTLDRAGATPPDARHRPCSGRRECALRWPL